MRPAGQVFGEWLPDLPAGVVAKIYLEQTVPDSVGQDRPGPHPVGRVRTFPDGRMTIRVFDTQAARDATALLEAGVLDVVWDPALGVVRLGVFDD